MRPVALYAVCAEIVFRSLPGSSANLSVLWSCRSVYLCDRFAWSLDIELGGISVLACFFGDVILFCCLVRAYCEEIVRIVFYITLEDTAAIRYFLSPFVGCIYFFL